MKWLKSTTDKAYTAQGVVIPPSSKAPLAVNEEAYKKITSMPVIKSLINSGGLLVLQKYTAVPSVDAQTRTLQTLQAENSKLADRIRELEAKTPESTANNEAVEAAQKAQSDAEAKLAELQAKYEALEKEANEKIAALSAETTTTKKSKKEEA